MNIEIARPYAFYALFLLIPSSLFTIIHYFRLIKSLKNNFGDTESFVGDQNNSFVLQMLSFRRLKQSLLLREFCRFFAWIFLVFALAGISWGSQAVPVPKTGASVSLVFDISYSMLAPDAPGGRYRIRGRASGANGRHERVSGDC